MSEDFINLEKKPNEKKDIALSILVLIVVFILVFSFVTIREYGIRNLFSSASQRIIDEIEIMLPEKEVTEEEKEEEVVVIEETSPSKEVYKEKAEKGDGLTHLARRATTSYMEDEGVTLSSEERIYIEDYVQKRLAPEKTGLRHLEIGEEVEIPVELIEEAVSVARGLSPTQIQNLSQYAVTVSF
jgi:ABC-type phosphate/phosphonate transport system permease subunit